MQFDHSVRLIPTSSFFYGNLQRGRSGLNTVIGWRHANEHLLDASKILIPIHLGVHWALAVVNLTEK
jgi:Ulp1 family protease